MFFTGSNESESLKGVQGRERFGDRDLLRLDRRLPVHEGGASFKFLSNKHFSVIAVIVFNKCFSNVAVSFVRCGIKITGSFDDGSSHCGSP